MENKFDIVCIENAENSRILILNYRDCEFKIRETRIENTDIWIVSDLDVKNALDDNYNVMQPMFFGIMIDELIRNDSKMPILGVSIDEMNRAILRKYQIEFAFHIASAK